MFFIGYFVSSVLIFVMFLYVFFFFFKQKTAYEMRIRDWSSYVCSSDLSALRRQIPCSLVMWVFGFSSSHLPIFVHGIQSLQTLKARCSPMPSTLWRDAQSRTCFMSCCSSWGLTCVYL